MMRLLVAGALAGLCTLSPIGLAADGPPQAARPVLSGAWSMNKALGTAPAASACPTMRTACGDRAGAAAVARAGVAPEAVWAGVVVAFPAAVVCAVDPTTEDGARTWRLGAN
jgi:hypothetical protein